MYRKHINTYKSMNGFSIHCSTVMGRQTPDRKYKVIKLQKIQVSPFTGYGWTLSKNYANSIRAITELAMPQFQKQGLQGKDNVAY